ncbi:hypothetical protein SAMN06265220_102160 [Flavobacterium nitrogenifigens]|uniref:Uncharacterized protein n=1 Tax=Flavobacterium nitrogenifigens TaxID=1617283 RepID=A0A521CAE7_9FLAO|nr:hypothetical protein SAMN06265220_102160 [Flavobacterium nitrogenifigens]
MIEFVSKTYYPIGLVDYFAKILLISKLQSNIIIFLKLISSIYCILKESFSNFTV